MYGSYAQLLRYQNDNRVIRIAKYARCSSDEQKKNGYTIGDQLSLMDEFSKDYELVSVGDYIDEGVSATLEISKRKALAQMIEDAKAGKFDIIVIKCIDRFFRSVEEYYAAQKQLRQAGVTWISIEEPDLDPENDDAAFKINIYLTMAEYEARKTSKRIKFNNKMRIKNKQVVTGSQCFHFPWTVVGEKRERHLEKNPETGHILMDLLEFFETHQSKSATLGYINIKYAMTMSIHTLDNLLKDTLLYGEYKGVPDYVEPYITKERFDHIQDIMKRNTRVASQPHRLFLFSSMIQCPECGRNLVGNYSTPRPGSEYFQYRCNTFRLERTCSNNSVLSERKIEAQLLDNLAQYINAEIARFESVEDTAPKNDNKLKAAKIENEMERLNLMFRKGRIKEDEYDADYLKLEKQLKALDIEEEPPERNLDALRGILDTDYRELYEKLDKPHKKAFWRTIIKEFTVDADKQIVPESIVFF